MSVTKNWGKLWTTIQGGGKFLGVTDDYACRGDGCQTTQAACTKQYCGWPGYPGNTHGLNMQEFDPSMFTDTSVQFTLDPATQRPSVNYKGKPYLMDFTWEPFPGNKKNYMIAPYVTTPNNFQMPNFESLLKPGGSRNFHGWKQPYNFANSWADIGLCYNPSSLTYPVTVGSVSPQQESSSTIWPAAASTPGCNWIDFNTVHSCCAEIGYAEQHPAICSTDPNGYSQNGSLPCQQIMLKMCRDNWDQEICKAYLQSFENGNGIKDVSTVFQTAIINYINGMGARAGCGGNDYTSPTTPNACTPTSGPNAGKPRDDSKDDFINGTMLNFCSLNASSGVCDNIMREYCSQFTRKDLNNDKGLQTLCGCHISDGTALAPGTGCINSVCLNLANKKRQKNQYIYPGMSQSCDPLCTYAGTLQSSAVPCDNTICIMDNVGIDYINSNCGDANISQVCGENYKGTSNTGYCYMSDVEIGLINSTCGGATISQNCKACFSFTPENPSSAKPVDCANPSGKKVSSPGNGGGTSRGGSSDPYERQSIFDWAKARPFMMFGFAGLLLFMLFLILFFSMK